MMRCIQRKPLNLLGTQQEILSMVVTHHISMTATVEFQKNIFFPKCGLVTLFGSEKIDVDGWLTDQPGKSLSLTAENIFAKILCERHNNALGAIDDCIVKWIESVKIMHGEMESNQGYINISSREMALILLQIGCGMIAHRKKTVPPRWVEILFSKVDYDLKLYQTGELGDWIANEKRLTPRILEVGGVPIGCMLKSKGFTIATFIDHDPPPEYFPAKKIIKKDLGKTIFTVNFK